MAVQYSRTVTLTSDLTTIAYGFRPTYVRIDASTANTAYFNFAGLATTNSSTASDAWQLTSGAPPLLIANPERNGMSSSFTARAAVGVTAVIRIEATRL